MPQAQFRKVLVFFAKEGDARFLSHLDLLRTMDRAFRRSGLPFRFTEGLNPKVKLSFPTALPLGIESGVETVEVQVESGVSLREIRDRLGAALPAGLRVWGAEALFTGEKWRVTELHYVVTGPDLPSSGELRELLARKRVPILRRGREVDLRPLLAEAAREGEAVRLAIVWTESGTARPADVLEALGRDPGEYRVVKVGMKFQTTFGETILRSHEPQDPDQ